MLKTSEQSQKRKPPRFATWLLERILRDDLLEEVTGDLAEQFHLEIENGSRFKAWRIYWFETLNYFRPFAIRKKRRKHQNEVLMYQHHLLMAYRNFKRYKSSFFINLVGLSTGLAAAFLIYLWVADEISVDKFHKQDAQLYTLMERREFSGQAYISDESTGMLAETVAAEVPEVEYAAAVAPSSWFQKFTLSIGERNIKASGQYVGKDYLNIFTFPLIAGDKKTALSDKNSIVITRDLALRLFGTTENLLGKTIEFQHEREFMISGVMENVPVQSSEQFEFLLSFEYYKDLQGWVKLWTANGPHNFVVLKKGSGLEQFNAKIENMIQKHTDDDGESYRKVYALPFSDNYLHNTFDHGTRQGGRIEYVRLFSIIAIFILTIACINFMNLSTARASRRLKEVGVKKVVGAARRQLIVQFMTESVLLTMIALGLAIVLVIFLLPYFNVLTGKQIVLTWNVQLIIAASVILFLTGVAAGSYPALYLSGFNPATILKGKLNSSVGEVWARKGLVIFQFTLSVILIVAVVVVYKQIQYIQTKNLGFNKDNIIRFDSEGKVFGTQETFLAEIKRIPGVINASGTFHNIVGRNYATSGVDWEGKNPNEIIFFEGMNGGYELLQTLGMQVVDGRNYSRTFGQENSNIILNEAAIKVMGIKDPVGKHFKVNGEDRTIIGVLKDFHYESLHMPVRPMFYSLANTSDNAWYRILVKIEGGHEQETIEKIETFYKSYNPGFQFDFAFLDQAFQKQYQSEIRVAALSKYFAMIAIVISCLGLFGLTAFTAERRVKEIGIRKVLGSSRWDIFYLISSDFTKMVLAAILIAMPISYFVSVKWLGSFAYKIDLEIWFFALAGFFALLIAWLTVGYQAIKASSLNPTQCLKIE